jgi:dolichyl-phosphate beta-glucosyltransferase
MRVQLVIPCFNEANRLDSDAFLQALSANPDASFLFVDDGSTDSTPAILESLVKRGGCRTAHVRLARNEGKSAAVRHGILAALATETAPQFVGFWDADLSTPLNAIADFVQVFDTMPGIDIVIGARVKLLGRQIERNPMRHYSGRAFATVADLALRLNAYDTQCGAKMFRTTERVRRIFDRPFQSKWIFDLELLTRYVRDTGSTSGIYELPLRRWVDVAGSKLRPSHIVRAMLDLAVIALQRRQ